jgi:hypothetical protein
MELYGVTEKDMPPHHIRDLCRSIGYSGFEFLPDPTLAIIGLYGINLAAMTRTAPPWWRRLLNLGRLFADNRLQHGGLCVITK